MTKPIIDTAKAQVDLESSLPQLRMPDSDNTAEIALSQALNFCARKMGLADQQTVVEHLKRGNRDACKYFHYSVAQKVAESIGALDRKVKAIYVVDYDATPEDMCFRQGSPTALIHVIVWAERKTNALNSLIDALDRALVQHYVELIDVPTMEHLLDVQIVDDEDVKNRVGYGAMITSLYNRPIQIWER